MSPGLSDTRPQHLLPQKYQKAELAFTQDTHNRGFELLCGHSWLQSWIPTSAVLTSAYTVLSSHVLQFILSLLAPQPGAPCPSASSCSPAAFTSSTSLNVLALKSQRDVWRHRVNLAVEHRIYGVPLGC